MIMIMKNINNDYNYDSYVNYGDVDDDDIDQDEDADNYKITMIITIS